MKKQEKKVSALVFSLYCDIVMLGACLGTHFIISISILYPSAFSNQYRFECFHKCMIISGKNWKSDLNTD